MSNTPESRKALLYDALLGFLGFFSFLAFIQAVVNLFQPEPLVWPAVLALVLVVSTVVVWRARGRWRQ
ncbi:hypothetical protein [Corynebacterium gerontici]|uniref:Uncharacterized protein n=1 Tax=Corynebacterium gerontici TaxID=2079234 RepID=A0A3G6IYJ3_9CORY|nr:hypothetical protein [Corynebacterium gerontici]AZA10851.1 hypothetical protein CGERO_02635 [Corynebacterium gerontici]